MHEILQIVFIILNLNIIMKTLIIIHIIMLMQFHMFNLNIKSALINYYEYNYANFA